jgi:hypothetical protein
MTDLCIPNRRLYRKGASERAMPQVVSGLFRRLPSRKRTRGEVIARIVKANVGNQCLLVQCRFLFE